jgi:hypothetical protein
MTVALIDNGSLEAAAHLNLCAVATALSERTGLIIHPVSWKHSDRVPAASLGGKPAWTLVRWVRAQLESGEREFVFVPFFISAQGAIGSALRRDLEQLQREVGPDGFQFTFTAGLAGTDAITSIVAERVRETIEVSGLHQPPVIVVDHGGPSPLSAALRDSLAASLSVILGSDTGPVIAASMEGTHPPLLADTLDKMTGEVVIALLFLSPGRHAGIEGDVAQICRAAEVRSPGLRCHLTGLVGTHSRVTESLALALHQTLAHLPAKTFV